jgi:hypothetical protein
LLGSAGNAPATSEVDAMIEGRLSSERTPGIDGDAQLYLPRREKRFKLRITPEALGSPPAARIARNAAASVLAAASDIYRPPPRPPSAQAARQFDHANRAAWLVEWKIIE